jgi:ATP-dependent helicase STH1/SNF2
MQLREEMIHAVNRSTTLSISADKLTYRRMKRQTLREARLTEKIERQQRIQREHQERQKYMDYLQSICDHGRNLVADHYEHKATQTKLGRAVLQYHTHVEKEEQKKLERISKERMIALKNDDEEAYMKLIDVAKDTRLAQLLKQTGEFLNSLTLAVVDQKNDPVHARYREDDMDREEAVSSRRRMKKCMQSAHRHSISDTPVDCGRQRRLLSSNPSYQGSCSSTLHTHRRQIEGVPGT